MTTLIVGAAGMIGAKLARHLAEEGAALHLADVVAPPATPGARVTAGDLSEPGVAEALIADRPATIHHLAAVVSGAAERDFDLGYRINLDGTRRLLDAVRAAHAADGYVPRLVFASSVAVHGAPFPAVIPDDWPPRPLTSYGAQKAMGELLVADHARRGILEGISIRLPTIVIRPGAPNAAASGFFSGILREPIAGKAAVLPVPDTVRHWFASPRAAVGFLAHAAALPWDRVLEVCGPHARLDMPGVSATVAESIAALGRVVGPEAVARIRRVPDPEIAAIVGGWAEAFEAGRARALGFAAERSMDEIIGVHLEDERGGHG